MLKINRQLLLFLIFNYFQYGTAVNYSPYDNKQHYLLQAQQPTSSQDSVYQQNLAGNGNYQQMYGYYYSRPYQQHQQQHLLPHQSTQLWSGPPIVVEDDIQQQPQSSSNIPPTFYQQHPTSNIIRSSELLPFLHRNSKVLPPTVYNPQPTIRTAQLHYNNNNNHNNNVYHRDFRHQIDGIPATQHPQEGTVFFNDQQQQQHQLLHRQQQPEQPQQFYATNTNLRYNGITTDLTSLEKENIPDYAIHFKRYLENNPNRIKPIY